MTWVPNGTITCAEIDGLQEMGAIVTQRRVILDTERGRASLLIEGMGGGATKDLLYRYDRAFATGPSSVNPLVDSHIAVSAPPVGEPITSSLDMTIMAGLLAATYAATSEARPPAGIYGGEVCANGTFLPLRNPLAAGVLAADAGARLMCHGESARIAALAGAEAIPVSTVRELFDVVTGRGRGMPGKAKAVDLPESNGQGVMDISYIKGQKMAKLALEIAVAGSHNLIMVGSAGGGKSLLAKCAPGIMPPMTQDEALE